MLGLLWTASGLNKFGPYLLGMLLIGLVVCAAYWFGRSSGISSAKQKQLADSLNRLSKEAQDRAAIQSMRSSTAREQLRKRWRSQ